MMLALAAILTAIILLYLLAPLMRAGGTRATMVIVVGVAISVLAIYLAQGHPDMPDQPIASRLEARQESLTQVAAGVEKLQAHLAAEPDDVQGWLLLAQGQAALGHADKERDALKHVLDLLPDAAPIKKAIAAKLAAQPE